MKKVANLLRIISIKKRLWFGFIFMPLLVLGLFFCVFDVFSKQIIMEKSEQNSKQLLTIVAENFSLNVNKFEQQLDEIMQLDGIYNCIEEVNSEDYNQKRALYMELNNYINSKTHFLSNAYELGVYTSDEVLAYSKGFANFSPEIVSEYSNQANALNGNSVWFHTNIGKDGVVGMARAMYDREDSSLIGYIFLGLREDAFTSLFALDNEEDNAIMISDEEDRILFGQLPIEKGEQMTLEPNNRLLVNGKPYFVQSKSIQDLPWNVVNLVSEEYAVKELTSTRLGMVLYMGVILIFLILIMNWIYRSLYDPLKNILTAMDQVSQERLDIQIKDNGNDELSALAGNFNSLVSRIQDLILRVEQQQEEKREAEIKMLQAQINPHFLFNTLNTLRYLAVLNGDKPLAKGISALAKLLRFTITDSKELVDIDSEIENVKNYIIIQKLRYGNLFETKYDIPQDLKQAKIMKFLLQPIVENAIIHGFEEDGNNQLLSIRIGREASGIFVIVEDNGKGFELQGQEEKQTKKLSGIGMKNIEERIHLTYGTAYQMHIESELGKGTVITLHLPLILEGGESKCIE